MRNIPKLPEPPIGLSLYYYNNETETVSKLEVDRMISQFGAYCAQLEAWHVEVFKDAVEVRTFGASYLGIKLATKKQTTELQEALETVERGNYNQNAMLEQIRTLVVLLAKEILKNK